MLQLMKIMVDISSETVYNCIMNWKRKVVMSDVFELLMAHKKQKLELNKLNGGGYSMYVKSSTDCHSCISLGMEEIKELRDMLNRLIEINEK